MSAIAPSPLGGPSYAEPRLAVVPLNWCCQSASAIVKCPNFPRPKIAIIYLPSWSLRPELITKYYLRGFRALPSHSNKHDIGRAFPHDYERILHFCSCPRKTEAQYGITMTGVPIGHIAWHVDIGNNFYATSANGKHQWRSQCPDERRGLSCHERQNCERANDSNIFHVEHY